MATHCAKHDITVPEGGKCWNCEEQDLLKTPDGKEKAYRDPGFLAKRGGVGLHQPVLQMSPALAMLSQLTPDQISALLVAANAKVPPAGSAGRRVIA